MNLRDSLQVLGQYLRGGQQRKAKHPSARAALAVEQLEGRDLMSVDLAGNTLAPARDIGTLNGSRSFQDFVGASDHDDFYRFSLNSPSDFSLALNGLNSDADVALLNGSGGFLASSTHGGTSAEAIDRTLDVGLYFAHVYRYAGDTNYNLALTANPVTPPPVDYAGNITETARDIGTLSGSRSFQDFVGVADSNDYYRFTLSTRSTFSLVMSGLTADADVQLLNSSGSVIAGSYHGGTGAESINRTLSAGTYYVRVFPYGAVNTNYSLNVSASPALQAVLSIPVTWHGQTRTVTISPISGQVGLIDPTRTTWLVIHGRTESANEDISSINTLAQAIASAPPGDQVLTLDWRVAARSTPAHGILPAGGEGENWIQPVAAAVARALANYGFVGANLNLVGHSWGSYVADEIAERMPLTANSSVHEVNTIVALDPARDYPGGQYDPEGLDPQHPGRMQIDFAAHSRYSWAFRDATGVGQIIFYGSTSTPTTADESFVLLGTNHSGVASVFTNLVSHNDIISREFALGRLLNHTGPWAHNRYDAMGFPVAAWWSSSPGYEAVLDTNGSQAENIRYVDASTGQEVKRAAGRLQWLLPGFWA